MVGLRIKNCQGQWEDIIEDIKAELRAYTDEKLGDVESALDELHAYANALVGGDA